MQKQPILKYREPTVDTILQRNLAKEGYRILQKVKLCDALAKDPNEYLPQREFDYFIRAHLDFLVTRNNSPVFAVEFDGAQHFESERAAENDVMKNKFCKQAGLPLLRITSAEINEYDQTTLLDYMLMRYVAWQKEYPLIIRKIEELAATIGPDYDPEDIVIDMDPCFHFNLRHPFPARDLIVERLWRNHRIAWRNVKPLQHPEATYLCNVSPCAVRPSKKEQFESYTFKAIVWLPSGNEEAP